MKTPRTRLGSERFELDLFSVAIISLLLWIWKLPI